MPRAPAALLQRLETLRGEDGACCRADLRALAADARAAPGFREARARYQALADERRLAAAALLKRAPEMCACELQAALGLTHATVSHHMAALVDAGLVLAQRRGKWMRYRLAPDAREWVP